MILGMRCTKEGDFRMAAAAMTRRRRRGGGAAAARRCSGAAAAQWRQIFPLFWMTVRFRGPRFFE